MCLGPSRRQTPRLQPCLPLGESQASVYSLDPSTRYNPRGVHATARCQGFEALAVHNSGPAAKVVKEAGLSVLFIQRACAYTFV